MNRNCEICFSSSKDVLYTQHFNNTSISLMTSYNVVKCNKCGFIFADNIPSQKEFDKYYAEMSQYEFINKGSQVPQSYIDHNKGIIKFMDRHISTLRKDFDIMEIGCSTGNLLLQLKDCGYTNLLGIDPSEYCTDYIKNSYNIDTITGTVSTLDIDKKFDLIILSSVVEHFVDIHKSMEKITSMLKKGGVLFIEVPDVTKFHQYIFTPMQQFSIEHINYFSATSISNLLNNFNFTIKKIEHNINRINQTIDPNLFILAENSYGKGLYDIHTLATYIEESNLKEKIVQEKLQDIFSLHNKVIVWGVGTPTQRLLGKGLDLDKIPYFIDSNIRYSNKFFNDTPIKQPKDIIDCFPILISSFSHRDNIIKQIREDLKLDNTIISLYE